VDPQFETKVSLLHTNLIAGEFDLENGGVLVGSEFARNLRLAVGDRLAIYSPATLEQMEKQRGQTNEEAILPDEFTVRGIFDVGYYEYNANVIVTSLEDAQELYRLDGSVHGLLVMLDDPYRSDEVRRQLWPALGDDYRITTWMEENSGILNALIVEKNVMFYLLFFIMIVAAFGIMNSLITFVVQKTREIGVLKALGATRGQVLWLFLSQSLMVGVVGVLTGFGLGMLALHYRNEFLRFMNRMTGFELFPASIYSFSELPALIMPADIALICGSALVICVLAGLVPAWNAGRLNPVEALRHE
jgi:lipoprotein-releasing system permease protein